MSDATRPRDPHDPKSLIREAYRIEGITDAECRSIFVDWALSIEAAAPRPAITALLTQYGSGAEDHPMTKVLREGLTQAPAAGRRGGRAARLGS